MNSQVFEKLFMHIEVMFIAAPVGLAIALILCWILLGCPGIRQIVSPFFDELKQSAEKWKTGKATETDAKFALTFAFSAMGRLILIGLILHAVIAPW